MSKTLLICAAVLCLALALAVELGHRAARTDTGPLPCPPACEVGN